METEQATTVQPATYDELILNDCLLIAYAVKHNDLESAAKVRERVEYWVLRKHGKRS